MDRHATCVIGLALALSGCTCGGDDAFDLPRAPGPVAEPREEPSPRDPRVPPDFDLRLPEQCVVRYGESNAERGVVLCTTERTVAEVARWVERAWTARGWDVSERSMGPAEGIREHPERLDAREDGEIVATAVIAREVVDFTRLHLTRRLDDGRPFHAPDEPREWMQIERAPLPALPGESETRCNAAVRRECGAWHEAGGPDPLDCALDHRAPCGRTTDAAYLARAVEDAEARLRAAHGAYNRVGSRGARAWTRAQLRVELVGARANLARAAAADGVDTTDLAFLVAATRAYELWTDDQTDDWFEIREESDP